MQIVETTNEGLKRGYTVKISAKDISGRIEDEVRKIAPQIRMPGFRPGKVPANLVKKMHGPALHQEALNTSIREAMDSWTAQVRRDLARSQLGRGLSTPQSLPARSLSTRVTAAADSR